MKRSVGWSRPALDDIKEQISFIATDSPAAARRIANHIRDTGNALGDFATGRPGRVLGTYELVVARLPYLIAYELRPIAGKEAVVILRVIHTARAWRANSWPE